MRPQVANKSRRRGEWCPYCHKFAVEVGATQLRCHACGRVAELTRKEYEQIRAEYGPGGTRIGAVPAE